MTPNPLAKMRRLATALHDLRTSHGYNHAELGRKSGVSASVISRIENPVNDLRRANLLTVRRLLDALEVPRGSQEWAAIESYTEDASAARWWDAAPYSRMGDGQRLSALIEAGASQVRDYAGLLLPGVVQTAAYARHRILAVTGDDPAADPAPIVAGRLERQRRVATEGATEYSLVLEEQAIRRHPVPAPVMREQLDHLLSLIGKGVSIRVVPVDACLDDGYAPRAPFVYVTYPDPEDPPIVAVDNAVRVALVTDPAEVAGYAQLHLRLRRAALSDEDSAALIREVASSLATTI
ncbi:helix-turn-helix transcriptional regulator [Micromonospora sp. WMMD710]|uniref:helix-turn-helix domain-containing protein n=1 Tax=Micromonospora sp. WMMD710 TaxID=3016085 RepID=UPI002417504B|nr:helix-turn-helix transcriptional regulator [Micromonospora sp. WMMD710]MDG4760027.1 helix-turn-helix transcriptional regulator [Micromonospora sp. WMMD710]